MTSRTWMRLVSLIIAVTASLAVLGCSSAGDNATTAPGAATGTEAGGSSVGVTLKEYSVTPDPVSVNAGEVTFRVRNAGTIVHEMVIAKTDLPAGDLPVLTANSQLEEGHEPGDVDENQIDSPGEASDIPAGQTSSVTFNLEPGTYVLFCNLPGHYKLGMYTTFTVK